VKYSQTLTKYKVFPIRSNEHCVFHTFFHGKDTSLGENFVDVLDFFELNPENGLPPEEIVKIVDGQLPIQDSEEHNSVDDLSHFAPPEEPVQDFSWINLDSLCQNFDEIHFPLV
jgi:hypothetical protein